MTRKQVERGRVAVRLITKSLERINEEIEFISNPYWYIIKNGRMRSEWVKWLRNFQ